MLNITPDVFPDILIKECGSIRYDDAINGKKRVIGIV